MKNNNKAVSTRLIACAILSMLSIATQAEPTIASDTPAIRGLLKPLHEATLSSEISAKVLTMEVKEGKSFKKGDVLVRFDCARYKAELNAAQAEHNARKLTSENNAEMATYNAAANLDVQVSAAETAKAAALVDAANSMLKACVIYAPWPGRVVDLLANEHESVGPGKELLKILDDSSLEIELLVPSKWLATLTVGKDFRFFVDETQKEYQAKITALGAQVDPVSQTVRIVGRLNKAEPALLAGMSGSAMFDNKPK